MFDEDSMLCGIKYSSAPNTFGENMSEQVEYESDNSEELEKSVEQPNNSSQIVPVVNEKHHHEYSYSIALNRPWRQFGRPIRYGFEDMVAYALQVAKEMEFFKPSSYKEAITSKEVDVWIVVISE